MRHDHRAKVLHTGILVSWLVIDTKRTSFDATSRLQARSLSETVAALYQWEVSLSCLDQHLSLDYDITRNLDHQLILDGCESAVTLLLVTNCALLCLLPHCAISAYQHIFMQNHVFEQFAGIFPNPKRKGALCGKTTRVRNDILTFYHRPHLIYKNMQHLLESFRASINWWSERGGAVRITSDPWP